MADFWFGNLRKAGYFPAPNSGMDANSVGRSDVMEFENGGAYVAQSSGTHREFDLSWGVQEKSVMNFLKDYRNGVYGTGLMYMVDPFAQNALPPHWANPGLTCEGWPSLVGPSVKPVRAAAGTVTNLATNPRMVSVNGTITVRTNLVSNPKSTTQAAMIVAGGTFGTGGTGTVARVNGAGFVGTGFTRATVTTAPTAITVGSDVLIADIPNRPAVTPGEVVTLSVYVRSNRSQRVRIQAQFLTGAGAGISTAQGVDTTLTPNVWTRLSVTNAVVPATAGLVRLDIDYGTSPVLWAIGDVFDADALLVEKSPLLGDYFDGDTAAGGDFTYAWSTTPNASWSLQRGLNPETVSQNAAQVTGYRISAPDTASGYAARFILNTTANMGINIVVPPTGLTSQLMTILMRVRASRAMSVRPRLFLNQTNQGNVILPANEWVTVKGTVVVPTTTEMYTGLLIPSTSGHLVGDTIDLDCILVALGDYTGPYFDGSTEFLDGTKGAWAGATDASASTLARTPGNMPNTGAMYTLTGEVGVVPTRKLTLLVPDNRDLWLGFSGASTNGGVIRMRGITKDGAYGPVSDVVLLDPSGSTRLNTKVSGSQYSAVQLYMTTTLAGAATVTLVSGKAVYSETGVTPVLTGDHVEGDGHTGFQIGDISTAYIQAADGHQYVTTATKATEMEAWI